MNDAARVLDRFRLEGDDRLLAEALAERPETTWPACCNTGCRPCMKTIHAAARALRALDTAAPTRSDADAG